MDPIYKEARRCYRNQEMTRMRIETDDLGGVFVVSKEGKFLQCFASRLIAERHMTEQCSKASKFIQ